MTASIITLLSNLGDLRELSPDARSSDGRSPRKGVVDFNYSVFVVEDAPCFGNPPRFPAIVFAEQVDDSVPTHSTTFVTTQETSSLSICGRGSIQALCMRQNLGFALVYSMIGIPIAAGVLYLFTGILFSPIIAALAMSFSPVFVVGNALRLRTLP